MTRLGLTQRIARLEDAVDGGLPLYIRHWLGEALTPEQVVEAAAEWEAVRTLPAADPATFAPDIRAWLFGRDDVPSLRNEDIRCR